MGTISSTSRHRRRWIVNRVASNTTLIAISYVAHIVLPLLLCAYIYTCCRPAGVGVQQLWLAIIGSDGLADFQKAYTTTLALNDWIVYSLPAALWTFSVGLLACVLQVDRLQRYWLSCLIPLSLTLGLEFLQYVQLTDGTFDPADIGAGLLGYGAAALYTSTHPNISFGSLDLQVRRIAFAVLFACVYVGDVWVG